jgi:hypothetical protein
MVAVGVCALQLVQEPIPQPCKLIVFPKRMGTPAVQPEQQPPLGQQPPWNPHWYGNLAQWIAPSVTLVIGIIMVSLQVHYRNVDSSAKASDEHINSLIEAKLSTVVTDTNRNIDAKLSPINEQLRELNRAVGQIQGKLGIFEASQKKINIRLDQQASLAKLVLSGLQTNLNAIDQSTPRYWPTAAEFISYRSQVSVGTAFETLSRPDMPNCTDHLPTPMEYRMTSEEERGTKEETNRVGLDLSRFIPAIYENCRFVLDSPEEAEGFPFLGRSFDLEFKNCQIIYNGGSIAIFTPNPRPSLFNGKGPTRGDLFIMNGQKLRFENCLFLFTIKAVPPQEGQQMTHELLAQSGPTLSYGHVSIAGE